MQISAICNICFYLLNLCNLFLEILMFCFFPDRICEDYIAKNVKDNEVLRNQLPCLPTKLLTAVKRRISFYRPTKKQKY